MQRKITAIVSTIMLICLPVMAQSISVGSRVLLEYQIQSVGAETLKGIKPIKASLEVGESAGLLKHFEKAIIGKEEGNLVSVTIPKEQAYGNRRQDLVKSIDKDLLPSNIQNATEGRRYSLRSEQGQVFTFEVIKVGNEKVTIDQNHPLAGKDLVYEVMILEVEGQKQGWSWK